VALVGDTVKRRNIRLLFTYVRLCNKNDDDETQHLPD